MALDTRIPLMVQPVQLPDFNAMAQNRLGMMSNVMTIKSQQAEIDRVARQQQEQNALRGVYSRSVDPKTGKIDSKSLITGLAGLGRGDLIPGVQAEMAKAESEQAAAAKAKYEFGKQQLNDAKVAISSVKTPEDAYATIDSYVEKGSMDPQAAEQIKAQIRADPKSLPAIQEAMLRSTLDAEKKLDFDFKEREFDWKKKQDLFSNKMAAGNLAVAQGNLGVNRARLNFERQKDARDAAINGPGGSAPQAFSDAARKLADLKGALKEYRASLDSGKRAGMSGVTLPAWAGGRFEFAKDDVTASQAAKYTAVMMGLKDLYQLGALAGPDISILERQLTDPSSFAGTRTETSALKTQLNIVDKMIDKAARNLESTYRRPASAFRDQSASPVRAPSKGKGVDTSNPLLAD
ncbi:hypothetical protein ACFSTI_25185 [Rhizorhabdus histidinilytica]|uniref:Uncharacterized protein n=1 Tax=Rhizorhabdus histidinilytica TaxID=439228 RepID=A0A1T5A829_9SPHN|nr:hypothetical protein [Rhizorhabdus histidinilytica]SKB30813.1 hypothetical protein SAMN06295920_101663 [Rhizorhabdus histidinilytica]